MPLHAQKQRQLLGELLVDRGLISLAELDEALAEQRRTGEFLGTILVRLGAISSE